jgi:SAM-dependent methyltransferase
MARVFRLFLGYLFAQIFVRIISAWRISSMLKSNSDNNWEKFGREDPYFSILTDDKYHSANLSEDLKKEFFNSGHKYVVNVFEIIKKHINPSFYPQRTMDFGCGTGRLIIPMSQFSTHVVGVDISVDMLREAQRVCSSRGITNVSFARSDDELSELINQKFDFIHSIAVFQHIDVHRGERIIRNMLSHLNPGGVGAIGVAYHVPMTILRRIYCFVAHKIPMGRPLTNLLKGRNIGAPVMQMNPYNLNRLLLLLQEYGVSDIHLSFTESSGDKRGVLLCFEMPRA